MSFKSVSRFIATASLLQAVRNRNNAEIVCRNEARDFHGEVHVGFDVVQNGLRAEWRVGLTVFVCGLQQKSRMMHRGFVGRPRAFSGNRANPNERHFSYFPSFCILLPHEPF